MDRPVSDQGNYLSWRAMNVAVRPHLHDPRWESLLSNKWLFSLYYPNLGGAVPKTYGLLHPINGISLDGRPLRTREDFLSWLKAIRPPSLVVKPLGGNKGQGVHLIRQVLWMDSDTPRFLTIDGRELEWAELFDSLGSGQYRGLDGYILQDWVAPHPEIQRLTGGAPYSLRVVTALRSDGQAEVQLAALRIGSLGARVDAWSQGGLAAAVDVSTGQIGSAATRIQFGAEVVHRHPDTGAQLTGTVVPCWDQVKIATTEIARMTPGLRVVGWDVVISSEGPRIVEGNFDWSLQLVQAGTGGLLQSTVTETWQALGADIPDGTVAWRWRNRRRPLVAILRRLQRRMSPA